MNDLMEPLPPLSRQGLARRDAILVEAKSHARRRRTRRRAAKVAAVCVALSGVGILFAMRWARPASWVEPAHVIASHDLAPRPVEPLAAPVPDASPAYAQFRFSTIRTDRSLVAAHALPPGNASTAVVSDDQLLDSLHNVGVDAGLARVGSQSLLVLNDTFRPSPPR